MITPIALFVYNRPWHTQQTVESLLRNIGAENAPLYVFSDSPKDSAAKQAVLDVRAYIRQVSGFKSVTIIERESHGGLARSIIDGVTMLCERFGAVVVVEDDLVLAPTFLRYMNASLKQYQDEPRVMQISGYMFPVDLGADTDCVFLPITTSWGWGTWQRAWSKFDPDMRAFDQLSADKRTRQRFNLAGAYDYFGLLQKQIRGEVDSWAIRWYLSVFMEEGLILYPSKTLVANIGFDGSGTHCGGRASAESLPVLEFQVNSLPDIVELHENWTRVLDGFRGRGTGLIGSVKRAGAIVHRAVRKRSRS